MRFFQFILILFITAFCMQSCCEKQPVLSVPEVFNANDFSESYSSFVGYNAYGVPFFSQVAIPAVADLGLGSEPVFFYFNGYLCWAPGNSFPVFMSSPRNAFFTTKLKMDTTVSLQPVYNYYLGFSYTSFFKGNYINFFWDTQSAYTVDFLINNNFVEPLAEGTDMTYYNFVGNKGKDDFDSNENPSRNSFVAFHYDAETGEIDTINLEQNNNVSIQGRNIITVARKFPYSGNGNYTMEFNIDADNTLPDDMVDDDGNSVNVSFTF